VIVQTPIGRIKFDAMANGSLLAGRDAQFSLHAFSPELPPGMSVEKAYVILVTLLPASEFREIIVRCHWLDAMQVVGDPESGQNLDAQTWQTNGWIVAIGTEDFEVLETRLPQCGFTERNYPVRYHPHRIEVHTPSMQEDFPVTLHFVVAINPWPEPMESSAWFALDVPHDTVLTLAGGS
jgi:hypothetical protein